VPLLCESGDDMSKEKEGTNWRAWFVGILVTLAVIVALQNSADTHVDVLFVSTSAPLIVILLIFLGIGALIGYVGPVVRRHRRQERHTERD
jgi:uncharacterized integral membrane protein